MGHCRDIEPQLTAYVDGEVEAAERGRIESHLQRCPPCRSRVATEQVTHELLVSRRDQLRGAAPEALHRRCAAQRLIERAHQSSFGRRLMVPLSVAAMAVFAVGLLLMFGWGSSVETYAAQLADDHVSCFKHVPQPTTFDPISLGLAWQKANGWPLKIAASSPSEDLHLLDVRRCGSSKGHVAHLLYRWHGQPLSVYVLNGSVAAAADATRDPHAHETVTAHGEEAVVWRNRGRTYAVVARAPRSDVERVAAHIRSLIE